MIAGGADVGCRKLLNGHPIEVVHERPAHSQRATEVLTDLAGPPQRGDADVRDETPFVRPAQHDQRLDVIVKIHVLPCVDGALAVPEHVDRVYAEAPPQRFRERRELGAVAVDVTLRRQVNGDEPDVHLLQTIAPGRPGPKRDAGCAQAVDQQHRPPRQFRILLRLERHPVDLHANRPRRSGEEEGDLVAGWQDTQRIRRGELEVPDVHVELELLPVVIADAELALKLPERDPVVGVLVQEHLDVQQATEAIDAERAAHFQRRDSRPNREQQDLGRRSLFDVLRCEDEKAIAVDRSDVARRLDAHADDAVRHENRVLDIEPARRLVGDEEVVVVRIRCDPGIAHTSSLCGGRLTDGQCQPPANRVQSRRLPQPPGREAPVSRARQRGEV